MGQPGQERAADWERFPGSGSRPSLTDDIARLVLAGIDIAIGDPTLRVTLDGSDHELDLSTRHA